MTAYSCRHTAASTMLNAGVPPKVVARRLGHDVAVLLRIYASVMTDADERANELIDGYRASYAPTPGAAKQNRLAS
jgi:integrase